MPRYLVKPGRFVETNLLLRRQGGSNAAGLDRFIPSRPVTCDLVQDARALPNILLRVG
jgi:hypothetical protein